MAFRITEIPALGGMLGIANCPGVHDGRFRADRLRGDLDALSEWGAIAVICLLTEGEVEALDIDRLSHETRLAGIGWHQLAIEPAGLPGHEVERTWSKINNRVHAALHGRGRLILMGRSPMRRPALIAARLLIEGGAPAPSAIRTAQLACPDALLAVSDHAWLGAIQANM